MEMIKIYFTDEEMAKIRTYLINGRASSAPEALHNLTLSAISHEETINPKPVTLIVPIVNAYIGVKSVSEESVSRDTIVNDRVIITIVTFIDEQTKTFSFYPSTGAIWCAGDPYEALYVAMKGNAKNLVGRMIKVEITPVNRLVRQGPSYYAPTGLV